MPSVPFEPVLVAALNFGTALIELIKEDRATMDPEHRKRLDEIRIRGLERVERILSLFDAKMEQPK